MKNPTYFIFALGLLLTAWNAQAQSTDEFSSFEERMTGKEFTEAGLHKLTPEELAALNSWVRNRSLAGSDDAELQAALAEAEALERALAEAQPGASGSAGSLQTPRETFSSSIVGSFSGWEGGTEFVLENGMVWEQVGNDRYTTRNMENPTVTLRPGLFGNWSLQVEGYNKRTNVRRVR